MMELYSIMDMLLPFDWARYTFMKHAFLAILLVTPLFGLLSTMVVSNRMAFFSDSLGHGAFTGIAIGVLLGAVSPLVSLVLFSVAFAVFITYIKNKSTASTDTIIGVFSSTAIALGLMIMSHGGGFNKFSSYLIGDVLSITAEDLQALLLVVLVVLGGWALLFNRLLVLSLNSAFARSRGMFVSDWRRLRMSQMDGEPRCTKSVTLALETDHWHQWGPPLWASGLRTQA
jgi:zinc transport system permease protein